MKIFKTLALIGAGMVARKLLKNKASVFAPRTPRPRPAAPARPGL